ncbi:MAG TPA: MFS transporter [Fimbriimonadaceae bacterium]|nr:MFS transporter [Fimbriimonadaceae bacterium]HRJ96342.1 MFS transporter [Fimbriimonadaceae bacterium]
MEAAATTPTKPLWKRPSVLRLLAIALLAEIGYAVLNISAMPVYLKFDRHMSASVISLVLVAFLLSEAVMKSPMGHLADRLGRKRLIVIGPALTFFTALLTLAVPHDAGAWEVLGLVFLRILDGVGAAMLWPAAFALMGETVSDKERQQAMSLLNMCYLLGVGLALPIGGLANQAFGAMLRPWTGDRSPSFFLAALLFAAVAITAYRFLPSSRTTETHHEEAQEGFKFGELVAVARRIPAYLSLAVVTFAGIGFPMAIIKIFAEKQFGMGEAAFGFLVLPGAAAMAFLSVPMSRFGEHMGRARAVHVGLFLCMAGMGLIAMGAFFPFLRHAWLLAIGGIPVGLGFLLAIPAWFASVSDVDPKRRAANLGAVMTAQGLGAIIGAPLGGLFYEQFQRVDVDFGRYSPFLGTTACLTVGWLLSLKILHKDPVPAPIYPPEAPVRPD